VDDLRDSGLPTNAGKYESSSGPPVKVPKPTLAAGVGAAELSAVALLLELELAMMSMWDWLEGLIACS
jgi:hypothetical protein